MVGLLWRDQDEVSGWLGWVAGWEGAYDDSVGLCGQCQV